MAEEIKKPVRPEDKKPEELTSKDMQGLSCAKALKLMSQPNTQWQRRFVDVLGDRTSSFLASVVSAVNGNNLLQQAAPDKILACAMESATLQLDVAPSLGFAAIVPYKTNGIVVPQFQLMVKGIKQLAIRSGQYKTLNSGYLFTDEYMGEDFVTGEIQYRTAPPNGLRSQFKGAASYEDCKKAGVAGFFFYFRLKNGYEKLAFMDLDAANRWGLQYSQSYKADIKYHKQSSLWHTNFLAMGTKTIAKNTISNWGPMSTEMREAFEKDQQGFDEGGAMGYIDTEQTPEKAPAKKKSQKDKLAEMAAKADDVTEGPQNASEDFGGETTPDEAYEAADGNPQSSGEEYYDSDTGELFGETEQPVEAAYQNGLKDTEIPF